MYFNYRYRPKKDIPDYMKRYGEFDEIIRLSKIDFLIFLIISLLSVFLSFLLANFFVMFNFTSLKSLLLSIIPGVLFLIYHTIKRNQEMKSKKYWSYIYVSALFIFDCLCFFSPIIIRLFIII